MTEESKCAFCEAGYPTAQRMLVYDVHGNTMLVDKGLYAKLMSQRRYRLLVEPDKALDQDQAEELAEVLRYVRGIGSARVIEYDPSSQEESGYIDWGTTGRGFALGEFQDVYKQSCTVQDSSSASEPRIWLGVSDTGPHVKGGRGEYNEPVLNRMHLDQNQARELVVVLNRFIETGSVRKEEE